MTEFDEYVERMEARRKEEKERVLDAWLCYSLRMRTKEEVLAGLRKILYLPPIVEKETLFF